LPPSGARSSSIAFTCAPREPFSLAYSFLCWWALSQIPGWRSIRAGAGGLRVVLRCAPGRGDQLVRYARRGVGAASDHAAQVRLRPRPASPAPARSAACTTANAFRALTIHARVRATAGTRRCGSSRPASSRTSCACTHPTRRSKMRPSRYGRLSARPSQLVGS
jgi:hypothetical protein